VRSYGRFQLDRAGFLFGPARIPQIRYWGRGFHAALRADRQKCTGVDPGSNWQKDVSSCHDSLVGSQRAQRGETRSPAKRFVSTMSEHGVCRENKWRGDRWVRRLGQVNCARLISETQSLMEPGESGAAPRGWDFMAAEGSLAAPAEGSGAPNGDSIPRRSGERRHEACKPPVRVPLQPPRIRLGTPRTVGTWLLRSKRVTGW